MSTETAQKFLPADLPEHFADVQQDSFVLRHLAGLLELVRLDDASKAAIESAYDRALHETGMYRNDEMDCLYFDSGLQTFTGRRIYIGLHRQDDGWKLDSTLRRSPDSDEPVGELLPPAPEEDDANVESIAARLEEMLAELDKMDQHLNALKGYDLNPTNQKEINAMITAAFDAIVSDPTLLLQMLAIHTPSQPAFLKMLDSILSSMQALHLDTDGVERLRQLVQGVSHPAAPDKSEDDPAPTPAEDDAPAQETDALAQEITRLYQVRNTEKTAATTETADAPSLRAQIDALLKQRTSAAPSPDEVKAADVSEIVELPSDAVESVSDVVESEETAEPYRFPEGFKLAEALTQLDEDLGRIKEHLSSTPTPDEGIRQELQRICDERIPALLRYAEQNPDILRQQLPAKTFARTAALLSCDRIYLSLCNLNQDTADIERLYERISPSDETDTDAADFDPGYALYEMLGRLVDLLYSSDEPDIEQQLHSVENEQIPALIDALFRDEDALRRDMEKNMLFWSDRYLSILNSIIYTMQKLDMSTTSMEAAKRRLHRMLLPLLPEYEPDPAEKTDTTPAEDDATLTRADDASEELDALLAEFDALEQALNSLKDYDPTLVDIRQEVREVNAALTAAIEPMLASPELLRQELKPGAPSLTALIPCTDRILASLRELNLNTDGMARLRQLLLEIDAAEIDHASVEITDNSDPAEAFSTSVSTPVENPVIPSAPEDKSTEAVETPVETEQNSPKEAPKEPVQPPVSTPVVDFSLPPQSLRDISVPGAMKGRLATLLNLSKLNEEDLAEDFAKGCQDATRLVSNPFENNSFLFLFGRKTPTEKPIVLVLAPNNHDSADNDSPVCPWIIKRIHFIWPSDTMKQQIYSALIPPYQVGESVLFSDLGEALSHHGLSPRALGYGSMLQMLSDMPNLFSITSSKNSSGIYSATILPNSDIPTAAPAKVEPSGDKPTAAPVKVEQSGDKPAAPAKAGPSGKQPPASMTELLISFPHSQQAILSRMVNGVGLYDGSAEPLTAEQLAQFRSSYDAAVADGQLSYDAGYDCYRFPLTLTAQDGSALSATLKRNTKPNAAPWYVSFIKKERGQMVRPGDRLVSFAYLGDKREFLRSLAEHAEPEQWSFRGKEGDYTILWNYIRYTFYRIESEDKIVFDEKGRFAAFDTGLLSRRFGDPLYAIFEPNQPEARSKWRFSCFCSTFQEGTRQERNMAAMLSVKPQMPSYFTNIYDTIFDPDADMQINYEHIFRDNLERFPVQWVHSMCDIWPRTREIMQQIDAVNAQITERKKLTDSSDTPILVALHRRRSELFQQLGEAVNDTTDEDMCSLCDNMIYALRGCIDKTLMRSRRNHQLAEPCFFPTRNIMSMLLPIRLYRSGAPDLALVLERQKSSVYIGRTVITMAMAYKNARLLRRFTSDWLNSAVIGDDDLEEE